MAGSLPYSIEHIGIGTDCPETLAQWYAKVLGFKEFFRTGTVPPAVFLEDGCGHIIEIFPRKPGSQKPPSGAGAGMHLALVVADLESAVAELEGRGVSFTTEAFGIFSGGTARFFADPEGNLLHIVHRPQTPWQERIV